MVLKIRWLFCIVAGQCILVTEAFRPSSRGSRHSTPSLEGVHPVIIVHNMIFVHTLQIAIEDVGEIGLVHAGRVLGVRYTLLHSKNVLPLLQLPDEVVKRRSVLVPPPVSPRTVDPKVEIIVDGVPQTNQLARTVESE